MLYRQTMRESLGLELPFQGISLYTHGIIEVGRNAKAFLENAAAERWYKRV